VLGSVQLNPNTRTMSSPAVALAPALNMSREILRKREGLVALT